MSSDEHVPWWVLLRVNILIWMIRWLASPKLRHFHLVTDGDERVVAVTFARDLGYIERVKQLQ